MALVVNATGDVAITTATGDYFTGLTDGIPRTASDKGPVVQEAIRINVRLLNRFLDPEQEREAAAEISRRKQRSTWILLVHRDQRAQELRCELSLPADVGDDSCIDTWMERIILSVTPFGGIDMVPKPDGENGPQSPEITIEIKRIG